MNTPAYFCFDDFGAEGTEVLPEKNMDITTGISTIQRDNDNDVEGYYSLDGRKLNTLQPGVNIVKMKNGAIRKIIMK